MKRQSDFLDALLRGAGPSVELLGAFAMGLLVVGVLGNLMYDLTVAPGDVTPVFWRPLLAALVFTGVAYFLYRLDYRRKTHIQVSVDESRLAPPYAGLISLFGPNVGTLPVALKHHWQGGGARHCWLVRQSGLESVQKAYEELVSQLMAEGINTQIHPVYIDKLDAQTAYEKVRAIFEREAAEEGLMPHEVIADITGGTKPLTAGMILAALAVDGALEYVESRRDDRGAPIPGAQYVVLVDTKFYLTREEQA